MKLKLPRIAFLCPSLLFVYLLDGNGGMRRANKVSHKTQFMISFDKTAATRARAGGAYF